MSIIQTSRPYIHASVKGQFVSIAPVYYFDNEKERQPYLYLENILDYINFDDYHISFADIASIIKSSMCIIVYDNNSDEGRVLVTPRDALKLLCKYSKKDDHAYIHTNDLIDWIKNVFAKWIDD